MNDQITQLCISIAACPGNFGFRFHNAGYEILGLNYRYEPRKVQAGELQGAIETVRRDNIVGCSVSMPHKSSVIALLDQVDPAAEKIGAVNTIKNENGRLIGYNTDYYGALRAVQDAEDISGKKVVMIGSGGVARAIGLAVRELGGKLSVSNRTEQKARDLAEMLGAAFIPWSDVARIEGFLLINSTSVGMNDPQSSIVTQETLQRFSVVKDVVIYPEETKLIKGAEVLGKKTIRGTAMCFYQAAKQFEIYTGQQAPLEEIKKRMASSTK